MSWLSILPDAFSSIEAALIKIFLILAFCTVIPWGTFLLIDLVLYSSRRIQHLVYSILGIKEAKVKEPIPKPKIVELLAGEDEEESMTRRRREEGEAKRRKGRKGLVSWDGEEGTLG